MEHSHGHNDQNVCCSSGNDLGIRQSLVEMEFERGIWYAAQYNDLDRVKTLLKKGISANVEDSAGYTALHYASRNGHYEMCKILLENDAKVNARTHCGHATALHRAAMQGHVNIVQLLLKSGADSNLKDVDGYTALHRAFIGRSESVCKLLIPCTNLTLLSNNQQSAEQLAKENCPNILPFLSEYINTE
ncbi:ankyrin repeat domain-containing protein 39-like isoform X1 [Hylaeus volcanicus]|uniref:ankyrin repeat domain-containing protein 39-like isoform X1 n=1 Tax=Hylaeus volcanicus TaxID=313075 RepID=UPI0023B7AD67|nr:ankyrin repeat domain-containing protein 39-like isoform X1 [Hylaeus volcanicus]XP_053980845.1 ankyrin repeat domain-containing protein 39-like isoform X1 [Hylaeus volcanicus]XP_053980846.1 ankyrin repeat domain-containing protein 39-like isoform X1 [Hylaeus volcanicus]